MRTATHLNAVLCLKINYRISEQLAVSFPERIDEITTWDISLPYYDITTHAVAERLKITVPGIIENKKWFIIKISLSTTDD